MLSHKSSTRRMRSSTGSSLKFTFISVIILHTAVLSKVHSS
jgi:hypothetical protein